MAARQGGKQYGALKKEQLEGLREQNLKVSEMVSSILECPYRTTFSQWKMETTKEQMISVLRFALLATLYLHRLTFSYSQLETYAHKFMEFDEDASGDIGMTSSRHHQCWLPREYEVLVLVHRSYGAIKDDGKAWAGWHVKARLAI